LQAGDRSCAPLSATQRVKKSHLPKWLAGLIPVNSLQCLKDVPTRDRVSGFPSTRIWNVANHCDSGLRFSLYLLVQTYHLTSDTKPGFVLQSERPVLHHLEP